MTDIKIFFKQLFCRHENCSWYTKESAFHSLNGERRYYICDDCGKELFDVFMED